MEMYLCVIDSYFLQDFRNFRQILFSLQRKEIFLVKLCYVVSNNRLNQIQFFFSSCYFKETHSWNGCLTVKFAVHLLSD